MKVIPPNTIPLVTIPGRRGKDVTGREQGEKKDITTYYLRQRKGGTGSPRKQLIKGVRNAKGDKLNLKKKVKGATSRRVTGKATEY